MHICHIHIVKVNGLYFLTLFVVHFFDAFERVPLNGLYTKCIHMQITSATLRYMHGIRNQPIQDAAARLQYIHHLHNTTECRYHVLTFLLMLGERGGEMSESFGTALLALPRALRVRPGAGE